MSCCAFWRTLEAQGFFDESMPQKRETCDSCRITIKEEFPWRGLQDKTKHVSGSGMKTRPQSASWDEQQRWSAQERANKSAHKQAGLDLLRPRTVHLLVDVELLEVALVQEVPLCHRPDLVLDVHALARRKSSFVLGEIQTPISRTVNSNFPSGRN